MRGLALLLVAACATIAASQTCDFLQYSSATTVVPPASIAVSADLYIKSVVVSPACSTCVITVTLVSAGGNVSGSITGAGSVTFSSPVGDVSEIAVVSSGVAANVNISYSHVLASRLDGTVVTGFPTLSKPAFSSDGRSIVIGVVVPDAPFDRQVNATIGSIAIAAGSRNRTACTVPLSATVLISDLVNLGAPVRSHSAGYLNYTFTIHVTWEETTFMKLLNGTLTGEETTQTVHATYMFALIAQRTIIVTSDISVTSSAPTTAWGIIVSAELAENADGTMSVQMQLDLIANAVSWYFKAGSVVPFGRFLSASIVSQTNYTQGAQLHTIFTINLLVNASECLFDPLTDHFNLTVPAVPFGKTVATTNVTLAVTGFSTNWCHLSEDSIDLEGTQSTYALYGTTLFGSSAFYLDSPVIVVVTASSTSANLSLTPSFTSALITQSNVAYDVLSANASFFEFNDLSKQSYCPWNSACYSILLRSEILNTYSSVSFQTSVSVSYGSKRKAMLPQVLKTKSYARLIAAKSADGGQATNKTLITAVLVSGTVAVVAIIAAVVVVIRSMRPKQAKYSQVDMSLNKQ